MAKQEKCNMDKSLCCIFLYAFATPNLRRNKQRIGLRKKVGFIFEKVLDFLSLLWYVVVITGGATYEKYYKRTVARKHHSARG